VQNSADVVEVARIQSNTRLYSLAVAPQGELIAAAGEDGAVKVWLSADRSQKYNLRGHNLRVFGLAFSPDGKLLASASEDKTVKEWKVESGELWRTLESHTSP